MYDPSVASAGAPASDRTDAYSAARGEAVDGGVAGVEAVVEERGGEGDGGGGDLEGAVVGDGVSEERGVVTDADGAAGGVGDGAVDGGEAAGEGDGGVGGVGQAA